MLHGNYYMSKELNHRKEVKLSELIPGSIIVSSIWMYFSLLPTLSLFSYLWPTTVQNIKWKNLEVNSS